MGHGWDWLVALVAVLASFVTLATDGLPEPSFAADQVAADRVAADEVAGITIEADLQAVPAVSPPTTAEDLGRAALAQLPVSPADFGFSISFHGALDGYQGLTHVGDRHIEIFVRQGDSRQHLAHVIAHEIGHAVDIARNDESDRASWRAARGMGNGVAWWPGPAAPDFQTGAGDFAECFAYRFLRTPTRSVFGSCAGTESLIDAMSNA